MKKWLLTGLCITFILILVFEISVPLYYEKEAEKSILTQLEEVEFLDVKISSHPALLLFFGKVQKGKIVAEGVTVNNIRIDKIESSYENLTFVKTEKGYRAYGGKNTHFTAEILEKDLNSYLKTFLPQFDVNIKLQPGNFTLNIVLENLFNLEVAGYLEVVEGSKLKFVPINLDQDKASNFFLSHLLGLLVFDPGLEDFPVPLSLEKVEILKGKIRAGGSE